MEPAALLKRVAMPGWVEMRVTKIDLRTDAARRFAVCTLDHWAGTPEKSEPQVVVKPRAVAAHERASALLGSWVAWTIVVVSCAAVLFDRGSPRAGGVGVLADRRGRHVAGTGDHESSCPATTAGRSTLPSGQRAESLRRCCRVTR